MTTMRLRFIAKKTPNAKNRAPNVEGRKRSSEFGVGCWVLDGGRLLRSLECLDNHRRITGDHAIRRYAFRHYGTGSDD
jgi:hypothetical protein